MPTKTAAQNVLTAEALESFRPLVKKVVLGMARRLPAHVDREDLLSVGMYGLVSAAQRYDASQGHTFEAYAVLRIRGAVLDELRRLDCLPRSARAKAREVQEATRRLEQKHGRTPTESELQADLGLSKGDFARTMRQTRPVSFFSLDQGNVADDGRKSSLHECFADETQTPGYVDLQREELLEMVADKISVLPERQQKVLALLYFEEMRLAEVASIFGVTEARICQIRTQALNSLRRLLSGVTGR